jgi:hypothetical protein
MDRQDVPPSLSEAVIKPDPLGVGVRQRGTKIGDLLIPGESWNGYSFEALKRIAQTTRRHLLGARAPPMASFLPNISRRTRQGEMSASPKLPLN